MLKGLNLTVEAGERVGVVGRTGSGKSSLLLCLLRLVEPLPSKPVAEAPLASELPPGPIVIDGVDVTKIGAFIYRLFGGLLKGFKGGYLVLVGWHRLLGCA